MNERHSHSPAANALPPTSKAAELAWAHQYCHDKGVRKTKARDALLEHLLHSGPSTWKALSEASPLKDLCNPSTVFRLLVKLEEIGLIRRLTIREKPPFFSIALPGEHHNDYVVCTECASIQDIQILCPGARLERQLEQELGFRQLRHEFAFYGVCKECVPAEE